MSVKMKTKGWCRTGAAKRCLSLPKCRCLSTKKKREKSGKSGKERDSFAVCLAPVVTGREGCERGSEKTRRKNEHTGAPILFRSDPNVDPQYTIHQYSQGSFCRFADTHPVMHHLAIKSVYLVKAAATSQEVSFEGAGGREEEPEKVCRIIRVQFTNVVAQMLTVSQLSRADRRSRKKETCKGPAHKSLSHKACKFHSGPRSNHACRKGGCNCDRTRAYSSDEWVRERYTHPRMIRILAFGLGFPGLPLKLTRRMPPQHSPPPPTSHSLMCDYGRSFTALWVGARPSCPASWDRGSYSPSPRKTVLRKGIPIFFVAARDGGELAGGEE